MSNFESPDKPDYSQFDSDFHLYQEISHEMEQFDGEKISKREVFEKRSFLTTKPYAEFNERFGPKRPVMSYFQATTLPDGTKTEVSYTELNVRYRLTDKVSVKYFPDGQTIRSITYPNTIELEGYDGIIDEGTSTVIYSKNGTPRVHVYQDGKKRLHNISGPSVIVYNPDGTVNSDKLMFHISGKPYKSLADAKLEIQKYTARFPKRVKKYDSSAQLRISDALKNVIGGIALAPISLPIGKLKALVERCKRSKKYGRYIKNPDLVKSLDRLTQSLEKGYDGETVTKGR